MLAELVRGDEELLRVGRPAERVGAAVPRGGQRARVAGGPVAHHHRAAIGLVAGAIHGQPRQPRAVGREAGRGVGGRVVLREVGGRLLAVDGRHEDVEVGAPRLLAAHPPRGEDQRLAVGGEGEVVGAAEGRGGRVGRHLLHHVHRFPAGHRLHEEVRAPAVAPAVPVAEEQAVVDAAGDLVLRALVEALLESRPRVSQSGKTGSGEGELRAVAGQREGLDVDGRGG